MKLPLNRSVIRPLSLAALMAVSSSGVMAAAHMAAAKDAPAANANANNASTNSNANANTNGAGAKVARADRSFMTKVAGGGMFEVEAAKMAEQKATDPAIKEHAAKLVKDHTQANSELMQLASSKGVTLPAKLPRDKQGELDKLSKLSGAAFDRDFMRRVGIADHQADIKEFEKGSRSAKDPELKSWIDKTLPGLRDHLAQAQKIPATATGSAKAREKMESSVSKPTGSTAGTSSGSTTASGSMANSSGGSTASSGASGSKATP
jgi:putative membrane protein